MALLKPNFFIIGAPKCGITSLHSYLKSHSQITMSNPKEPHYFSKDIKNGGIQNIEKYLSRFFQVFDWVVKDRYEIYDFRIFTYHEELNYGLARFEKKLKQMNILQKLYELTFKCL